MFTLRRIAWQSWPRPIDSESPSPEMPMYTRSRFAAFAPVASAGMRPCTPLNPCDCSQEVRGRLRRASDAAHLRRAMRRDVELPQRLDERRGDRVVAAPGAQRRHRAFVLAPREPECVLGERGVANRGLGDRSHDGRLSQRPSALLDDRPSARCTVRGASRARTRRSPSRTP